MSDKYEIMKSVFSKCDLIYCGQLITRELILQNLAHFLNETSEAEDHNVGIILHTGSVLFDVIAVVYAALSNVLLNETSGEDIVSSLQPGDMVVFGFKKKERYIFDGIITDKDGSRLVVLKKTGDAEHESTKVMEKAWGRILPYQGKSEITDGRGIKKQGTIRGEFFCEVLGYEKAEIPSYIDTSTVIVMPRDKANQIINNVCFYFGGKIAKLLDIVTATYYTETDPVGIRFSGNVGQNEPILKICGNVSVARQKITESSDNKNIGLMVFGSDLVARGLTEIPALMKRKALKYVYIALHIDSENGPFLLEQYDNSILFACTKDFLLSNSRALDGRGDLIDEMNGQIDAIIDREIKPVVLEGQIGWEEYKKFSRCIKAIRYSEIDPELKDSFIPNAFWVMNVFATSVFNITVMEKMVEEDAIRTYSPLKTISDLSEMIPRFPEYLKETAGYVVELLENAYMFYSENTPKEEYLRNYLSENSNGKIALIVPKAFYADIVKKTGLYDLVKEPGLLAVSTPTAFDNSVVYDGIVCLGDLSGKRFDPFRCRSSKDIISLLYGFESNLFKLKMKRANEIEKMYNAHTSAAFSYETEYEDVLYDDDVPEAEIEEIAEEESEINDYIRKLNEQSLFRWSGDSSGSSPMSVVSAVGVFESGHRIFFSQMYKAYVLDENAGEVSEKSVDDLREGDTLIFTQNNEKTKDIIDDILQQLISEKKLSSDLETKYYMSKRWKEALRQYKSSNGLRSKEIAEKMINNGVPVGVMTIRGWLDEDSHTVGPRDAISIQQIAYLVNDWDLFRRYQEYDAACDAIRILRMKILRMLGQAIIRKVSGKKIDDMELFSAVSDRIASLSMVLRLDSITIPEKGTQVPTNTTNRPFMLKE